MQLKTKDGYELISSEELHRIKKFAEKMAKLKITYINFSKSWAVLNRQANDIFDIANKLK